VFHTRYGHYENTVILHSLVNAPAAFQSHINNVLCKHPHQYCIAYLDNIIVYSISLEKYREHVQLIIVKLQEVGLFLKLSKCEFEMQLISFVRFIVTLKGIETKPDRVCTIAEWPEPTYHCDIQVFLSFANFDRCFISSLSCLAKLMTSMLKGGKNGRFSATFLPTLAMKQSFAELYDAFTKAPILAYFDPAKPIYLETNTLGFAITGIISQQQDDVHGSAEGAMYSVKGNKSASKDHWHPIAFWSWSMSPMEQNYAVGDQ
jgi:hypothetical protein